MLLRAHCASRVLDSVDSGDRARVKLRTDSSATAGNVSRGKPPFSLKRTDRTNPQAASGTTIRFITWSLMATTSPPPSSPTSSSPETPPDDPPPVGTRLCGVGSDAGGDCSRLPPAATSGVLPFDPRNVSGGRSAATGAWGGGGTGSAVWRNVYKCRAPGGRQHARVTSQGAMMAKEGLTSLLRLFSARRATGRTDM